MTIDTDLKADGFLSYLAAELGGGGVSLSTLDGNAFRYVWYLPNSPDGVQLCSVLNVTGEVLDTAVSLAALAEVSAATMKIQDKEVVDNA